MSLVIPVGYGLAAWHTRTTGDPEDMIWTVGLNLSGATDQTQVPFLMRTVWDDHLQSLTSSAVTLVATKVKMGPVSTGPTYELADPLVGTNGGSLAPPNCAVLVKKLTATGGRRGRGRAYLPGISSVSGSLNSGGNFSEANAADVSAAMQAMADDMASDTTIGEAPWCVLHSDSSAPSLITSLVCEPKLATQRRRMRP